LNQDIDLIITTIAGIASAAFGLFFLATGFWVHYLIMIIATLTEENGNRFEHAFAVVPMQGKPYLREQDNGGKCIRQNKTSHHYWQK